MTLIHLHADIAFDLPEGHIWPGGANRPDEVTAEAVVAALNDVIRTLGGTDGARHVVLDELPAFGNAYWQTEWTVEVTDVRPNPAHDTATPAMFADVELDPTITVCTEARW
jgi:hypothetical protein